ncbi:DUF3168 domain-containing protein [Magnetospirillum aberrantis]|uniref:DUF3168 domain-containing protein n=1 Tax=Magnetospirillum aberrantis SpK TaxID=908842 RepID=A0A7C9QT24_9PROT|nr:DUF3168 domain-containing protein [Magnetospirillum aberrantis]NFV79998.1 DUF3168 domain-containing protein [Magnetospirillum aberrantis SpK]
MSELAIYTLLKNAPAVSALAGARIYPLTAPTKVQTPYITYQRISGDRWRSCDGPTGTAQPRIQVDAYATTYAAAKALAKVIRKTLDGFIGTATTTEGPMRIGGISLETDQDLYEDDVDPKLYRVQMDFMVTHDE